MKVVSTVKSTSLSIFFLLSSLFVFLGNSSSIAEAGSIVPTTRVTSTGNYKDSFYFGWNNQRFLAVSDLTIGGISILRDTGNDNQYVFDSNISLLYAYAPQVYFYSQNECYIFYSYIPGLNFDQAKIRFFSYNMQTRISSSPSDVNFVSGNTKLYDATVWYQGGNRWYLVAAEKDDSIPYYCGFGAHLVWSISTNGVLGPYSTPVDLLDQYNGQVDKWRQNEIIQSFTNPPQPRSRIGCIVESPIWSWWDHNGNGYHELYWSIGPSDPYERYYPTICTAEVKAVRRGDIMFNGNTPYISVIGYYGGADDIMGGNEDCYLLTSPDFTANGMIRATGHRGGPYGTFQIVNTSVW
ncbi:MAG: hypothetical protein EPN88_09330 [Bacteroidetes bacterium]|nr:MAG: hypothetical protein EPN88_09330 [Bacteroidota bacterium]